MEENTILSDFTFYFESGRAIKGKDFKLEDYAFAEALPSSDKVITINPFETFVCTIQNAKFSREMLKPFYLNWMFTKKSKKYMHYIKYSKKKRTRIKYTKMYMRLCEKYKIRVVNS